MAWCFLAFFTDRHFFWTLILTFVLDVVIATLQYFVGISSRSESKDTDWFASTTLDTLCLAISRAFILPVLAYIALKVYNRTAATSPLRQLERDDVQETPPVEEGGLRALGVPLRGVGESASSSSIMSTESASARTVFEAQRDHVLLMKKADERKKYIMWFAYAVSTAMSMYNGLKCVGFHYDTSLVTIQGFLFICTLCSINAEYFLLLDYLDKLTEEKGELIPHMHMHPLFFDVGLKCHGCDVCHEAMKAPHYIAYRCRICDFDLCPRCHKKRNDPTAKGFGARSVRRDGEQLTTWSYFKRIIGLTMEFRSTAFLAIGSLCLTQMLVIWAPKIQGSIFDAIIAYLRDPSMGQGAFEQAVKMYLIINSLQGFFGGVKAFAQDIVLRKLAASVRIKLFQSVVRMDISFFDTMHTGQLTSRLTNDSSQMVQPLNTILNDIIANIMLLVGGAVMAFNTSWKLTTMACTVVPPITYCYRKYAKYGREINRSIYAAYGEANSSATEAISNIRTVRGFSTEQFEVDKYDDSINTAMHHGVKNAYVSASVQMFSTYLNLGTGVLIFWYGGKLVMSDEEEVLTVGLLITFQLYWNMMNSAFLSLGNVFNELIRSSSAAERVVSLIDARPEVDPDDGEVIKKENVKGHLRLESVEFRYKTRPENLVLKGINLEMQPGSTTALVGKSGGGKSTLVHLLMRFYEPSVGKMILDGQDMSKLSSRSVRKCCGFVAQDTQLFAKSIQENLVYGLGRDATKDEIVSACQAANAHEFIMETEEQYETRVGEKGQMMSGGQKQRLAIARCFLRRPRLLFLDEATSALDAENEFLVQTALDKLILEVGCTVVLIAHRLSTVINCNQIAVVHKGGIVEKGTHDELVAAGGIYAALVHRQMSRSADSVLEQRKPSGPPPKGGGGLQTEIDELIQDMEKDDSSKLNVLPT